MNRNQPERKASASEYEKELEKKMDALINDLKSSQARPASQRVTKEVAHEKSSADEYFDEIVDMLNEEDSIPETQPYEFAVEDDTDFFNQILSLIPKDQLPGVKQRRSKETDADRTAEINLLAQELEKLGKSEKMDLGLDATPKEYIDKKLLQRKDTYAQAARDEMRISTHYEHTIKLVRGMSILSPSRRIFAKILNNRELDQYDKVQRVIFAARKMTEARKAKQPGIIMQRINQKAYRIQDILAAMDINADAPAPLPSIPKR
jgi:hypothetical protein